MATAPPISATTSMASTRSATPPRRWPGRAARARRRDGAMSAGAAVAKPRRSLWRAGRDRRARRDDGQSRRANSSPRSDARASPLGLAAMDRLRLRISRPTAPRLGRQLHASCSFSTSRRRWRAAIGPASSAGAPMRRPFAARSRRAGAPSAAEMDLVLHRERLAHFAGRYERRRLPNCPTGRWSSGAGAPTRCAGTNCCHGAFSAMASLRRARGTVRVLTPPSSVAALAAGYRPLWADAFLKHGTGIDERRGMWVGGRRLLLALVAAIGSRPAARSRWRRSMRGSTARSRRYGSIPRRWSPRSTRIAPATDLGRCGSTLR